MIVWGERFWFVVFEPKWAQNQIFQVLSKVNACGFSNFLHGVIAA